MSPLCLNCFFPGGSSKSWAWTPTPSRVWLLPVSFHSGTFSWINSLMTSSPWFFGSVFLELLLDFGSLRLISSFCIFTLLFSILVAFYFSFWKSSSTLSSNACIELFGSAIKMCVFLAFFFVLWMFFFSLLLMIHLLYDEQCRNWKIQLLKLRRHFMTKRDYQLTSLKICNLEPEKITFLKYTKFSCI